MRTIPLPFETVALTGFNRKIILTYQDLISWAGGGSPLTSGTGQSIIPGNNTLGSTTNKMKANTLFDGAFLACLVTAFTSSGGAITSLYLQVGDGTTAYRFFGNSNGQALDLANGTVGAFVAGTAAATPYLYAAAATVLATLTITGQTIASLTAGVVELYYFECDLSGVLAVKQPTASPSYPTGG